MSPIWTDQYPPRVSFDAITTGRLFPESLVQNVQGRGRSLGSEIKLQNQIAGEPALLEHFFTIKTFFTGSTTRKLRSGTDL